MGVDIFWIGLNATDLGCWRLTLSACFSFPTKYFPNYSYLKVGSFFGTPYMVLCGLILAKD